MALVVSARATVEAQPALAPRATVPRTRPRTLLRYLALVGATCYALSLGAEAALRLLPLGDTLGADGSLAVGGQLFSFSALGLIIAVAVAAWVAARDDATLLLAATLAPVLAAARVATTGILVSLDLSTLAEVADLGLGLLVLGAVVCTAATALIGLAAADRVRTPEADLFRRVVDVTAFFTLALGLTGATVRAVGASWACRGVFPDCNGLGILPFGHDPLADIQLYHRLLAYVGLALVGWVAVEAFRSLRRVPAVGRAGLVLLGGTVAQAAIGIASISSNNPPLTQALHTLGAAATWSAAIVLAVLVRRAPVHVAATPLPRERAQLSQFSAYVQLTKPRVMSLLLATTATAMVIAARGMPDLGIFIATLVGGALMSGGAGAINHYVDRDIDPLMGRTAWRPIPSGVISPGRALGFGILLAVLASAVFLLFVNPTAWVLALIGLLGYVFIYTLWLKRSTPSNIVIGGAAGAIPPLVGWAAVTNEISSLTAWYLFAIIFFWTPPHFWALSLLIRQHYERAGVPMLPVVRGEDETRRQIMLYSVLLVGLTLVLSPFGMMGVPYFISAVVLGALFIRGAVRLWREATPKAARSLYLYSILYLFALFAAMAVDRVISAA
ncbi:MAG TPA: heme o synthase [Chloroflexota bacterium]|jgi:protoheme IX farnesyltransferase|nr:heme o synthase [Chloroflexota bacterium]